MLLDSFEMPSLTLKPCGEDKSRIKHHLLAFSFLGITPNGLVWMPGV